MGVIAGPAAAPRAPLPLVDRQEDAALHDGDYVQWLERQAGLLRSGRYAELDTDTLAEEIEALAGRDRRELKSRLTVLLTHLLKWRFQPSGRTGSWIGTLNTQRREIRLILEDSPSLRPLVPGYLAARYGDAVTDAGTETGLPTSAFPAQPPWTAAQALDPDYWPDA